jgi:hypothetical protein
MSAPEITIVTNYDDWEGLYVNGVLSKEGHKIRLNDVLEKLGVTAQYIEFDNSWIEQQGGRLPARLNDVKEADYEKWIL